MALRKSGKGTQPATSQFRSRSTSAPRPPFSPTMANPNPSHLSLSFPIYLPDVVDCGYLEPSHEHGDFACDRCYEPAAGYRIQCEGCPVNYCISCFPMDRLRNASERDEVAAATAELVRISELSKREGGIGAVIDLFNRAKREELRLRTARREACQAKIHGLRVNHRNKAVQRVDEMNRAAKQTRDANINHVVALKSQIHEYEHWEARVKAEGAEQAGPPPYMGVRSIGIARRLLALCERGETSKDYQMKTSMKQNNTGKWEYPDSSSGGRFGAFGGFPGGFGFGSG